MIIYKITNLINNKIYIGQTCRTLSQRWKEHCSKRSGCTYLHNAIMKYGKENFKVEQIDIAISKEDLDYKESYYIEYFNSIVPNGYNLNSGGSSGRKVSNIVCEKIKENHHNISGENNPMYGVKRPEVGIRNKLTKGKRVCQYSLNGNLIAEYSTIREAERITGIDNGWISGCCKGKRGYKTAGSFIWKYAE